MSSLKKIKTQKVHKERHQSLHRDHLGPLEKKKDYKKRVRDQHNKKQLLKGLHRKALYKNEDEFHFHMINSQIKDGVHYENVENEELTSSDVARDLTYVIHQRSTERKKIDKLKAQLHLLGDDSLSSLNSKSVNKHTLFVDNEKCAKKVKAEDILETHSSLLGRSFNRLRKCQLENLPLDETTASEKNDYFELSKQRNKSYKELRRRIAREEKLRIFQEKLEVRKKLMERKNKKTPQPVLVNEGTSSSAPLYRWPSERKK